MSAITLLLEMSAEVGFDTDDVCEAVCFLANSGEVELWSIDEDISPDSISITSSGPDYVNVCCDSPDGQVTMRIEVRNFGATVVDEWFNESQNFDTGY